MWMTVSLSREVPCLYHMPIFRAIQLLQDFFPVRKCLNQMLYKLRTDMEVVSEIIPS